MIPFVLFSVFILGTIVGSFLNVVILRYNTGVGIGGRSGCFSCGHQLRTSELIPILSYIALLGRCRECKSRISIQYPLVEFSTGILFMLSFWKAATLFPEGLNFLPMFVFFAFVWSLLMVIFAYDFRHKIIPDGIVYAFSIVSLFALIAQKGIALLSFPGYLDLLAGPLLFLPFYLLWKVLGGTWIGLGDGKLALGIGWFLGFVSGVSAVVVAFWIGAVVSLSAIAWEKYFRRRGALSMKSEIPFAPFLILGILVAFLWNIDVFSLSLLLAL